MKEKGKKSKCNIPRELPPPTIDGGALPLIPIFAGLSALGGLANGIAGISKAINQTSSAKKKLNGSNQGNISIGKGLYLRPYQTGSGMKVRLQTRKAKQK